MEKLILTFVKGVWILVFLFILIIFILLNVMLVFSKIIIEIENIKFKSHNSNHLNDTYKIVLMVKLFGIIPILKKVYDKNKIDNINKKLDIHTKIKKIDLNNVVDSLKENNKSNITLVKIFFKDVLEIININFKIELGTENAAVTAIIIGILSMLISIILRKKIENIKIQKYKIIPKYCNHNLINIEFSGIFGIKVIHIINIIYILTKERKVKLNEPTSNRKSYGYSYE